MKWLLLALKRTDSTDKTRENGRVLDKEGVEGGGRGEWKLTERADRQEAHSEKWQTLRASRLPLAETTYLLPLSCHASQSHSHTHYDLPLPLPTAPSALTVGELLCFCFHVRKLAYLIHQNVVA